MIKISKRLENSINENSKSNISNITKAAGADEMMPIIVYCLIKGNIRKIISNLNYIRKILMVSIKNQEK